MSPSRVAWLRPGDAADAFPNISDAMQEPNGLLAAGGDLSSERLLYAYRKGIFPWFDEGQPILWWSPDPRCVLFPADFKTSSRLRRSIASADATISINQSFSEVIQSCAGPRRSEQGTWITADMIAAYESLRAEGWAHSIEVRENGELTGGIYGLAISRVFFGESMFSRKSNASKLALLALCQILEENDFAMLDCQVVSRHLMTLGAVSLPRAKFASLLESACPSLTRFDNWPDSPIPVRDLRPK
jgi:leucyl/phenylalanyl-tRNA--protein transferase